MKTRRWPQTFSWPRPAGYRPRVFLSVHGGPKGLSQTLIACLWPPPCAKHTVTVMFSHCDRFLYDLARRRQVGVSLDRTWVKTRRWPQTFSWPRLAGCLPRVLLWAPGGPEGLSKALTACLWPSPYAKHTVTVMFSHCDRFMHDLARRRQVGVSMDRTWVETGRWPQTFSWPRTAGYWPRVLLWPHGMDPGILDPKGTPQWLPRGVPGAPQIDSRAPQGTPISLNCIQGHPQGPQCTCRTYVYEPTKVMTCHYRHL